MKHARMFSSLLACLVLISAAAVAQAPPAPSKFLGFEVGADRQLADYHQITAYFKALAAASPRVELESLGETTLGNDMFMAVISSPANLRDKARYQEMARRLADPRGLSQAEIDKLAGEGRAIVLVTCNIHSTEIGASQMAMEWAHRLATATDAETERRLSQVILLLVPSLNPDGQIMETEWYRKWVGTPYEGGRMPWLYHHYVGHDNNRDWYMLTQKETRALTRAVYRRWHPQVWLDEHQMGSTAPRIFVPPNADPVSANVHPLIFRGINHIGMTMQWRLEQERKAGVIYGYTFDAYWPGGTRNTAWWKNIFGLLSEVASVRIASPVYIDPSEMAGGRKGLAEHKQQINYPNPWKGGWWRLRDIIDYELIISDALLEAAADQRQHLLRGVAMMAGDAVAAGRAGEYWRIPMRQRDPARAARLAHLMAEHGVEVKVSEKRGEFLLPTAQPYGKFLEEMLGVQRYPEIRPAPGADVTPPYDVAAWSLPLLMDVAVDKTMLAPQEAGGLRALTERDWPRGGLSAGPAAVYAAPAEYNDLTRLVNSALKAGAKLTVSRQGFSAGGREFAAGTVLFEPHAELAKLAKQFHIPLRALGERPKVAASPLRAVRVGLYKPWAAQMDEGWTRWLLEQYGYEVTSLDNKAMQGKLSERVDALVLPHMEKTLIVEGRPRREEGDTRYFQELPPEYAGGIGREGVRALQEFVRQGGTLIALGSSGELITDDFNVPVRNALARVRAQDFRSPGSILRIAVDAKHPVGYGMPAEVGAFVSSALAWETSVPGSEVERSVVARYPEDGRDILMSGWVRGAERLERRAAVVTLEQGKGRIVLLGFRPQHRAQTESTFKLLFNTIQWAGME